MDDNYQQAQAENLRNPKNRFLFCLFHAKDVDNSWGCGWSFASGVIIFSLVIGVCTLMDIVYLADEKPFDESNSEHDGFYKFMMVIKIFSDIVSLIGIMISLGSVCSQNYTYAIVAYYVIVLSFFLNVIFGVYSIIGIFTHTKIIGLFFIPWIILDFGLFMFSWILFANQVYIGRERRKQANQTGY